MIILPMPGAERLVGLARDLAATAGAVEVHEFPDGESRVRLLGYVRDEDVVLAAHLDRPDAKVLPLLFAAETARDLGAASVGLVAPYMPYLRQDRRFHRGEGLSAHYFAALLSRTVDWVVTVDPHLHRVQTLADVFTIPAVAMPAAPMLARWISDHVEAPLILGPDEESEQWVAAIAGLVGAPHAVCRKERLGDRTVDVHLPDLRMHRGRHPVLVDDVVASGTTLATAAQALREDGWPASVCLVVHAIFAEGAEAALREAGIGRVVTCNTIPHATNGIDVDGLLGSAVARRARASTPIF